MGSITAISTGQYLVAAGELQAYERPVPAPNRDEVQIALRSTTLCGSDIHYYQKGRNGSIEVREPLCLGHESAGSVVAVGSGVDLQVGDRVAIECGVPCDGCEWCRAQQYNLCPKLRFRGSGSAWPHFQGTLQTLINHPAKWTHRLPSEVSYEEGALLEPLSVAVHACRRVGVTRGSRCTIIGAGAIGLLCAVAARDAGCTQVAIADIVESRVAFALAHGFADVGHVVRAKRPSCVEESMQTARSTAESITTLQWPDDTVVGRADFTFECTGVEVCVQTAIYTTKSGGKVALVGMGTPNIVMPISDASAREVDIVPTWRYANSYPRAIHILKKQRCNGQETSLGKLITHRFYGIDMVPEALRTASLSADPHGAMVVKVVVNHRK